MASIRKMSAVKVGRLFQHNNRTPDDGVQHANEDIDASRTVLNYHLKYGTPKDVSKRTAEVFHINRDNVTVLGEVVVTLPANVPDNDERRFFESVYRFYQDDFGERNIINAVIHKDESKKGRPHMHLDFVPVVKTTEMLGSSFGKTLKKWKSEHDIPEDGEYEKLCAKELINQLYLQQMHGRLMSFVSNDLGYEVEILNGATAGGNKTVQELKIASLIAEKELLEKEVANLRGNMNNVYNMMQKLGLSSEQIGVYPLLQKISHLENKVSVMREIIIRNRCSYTKTDINNMRSVPAEAAAGAVVSVFDGSIVDLTIDDGAIIVIEMYSAQDKPMPQQKLIEKSGDITIQMNFAKRIPENVVLRKSRMSDRLYLFLKNDEPSNIIELLKQMGKVLEKNLEARKRRIYMDRMKDDEFDFAKAVLTKLSTPVTYCTTLALEVLEKEEEEQNKDKLNAE